MKNIDNYFLLFSFMLFILCQAAYGQEGNLKSSYRDAKNTTLDCEQSQITLSSRGVLIGITDKVTNTALIHTGKDIPAWRIIYADKGELTSKDYDPPIVKNLTNGLFFIWRKKGLPTVRGKIIFEENQKEFKFSVRVIGHRKLINHISFPAELNFPADKGNYAIVAADQKLQIRIHPLGTLEDFIAMYPGLMFMQMSGFKIGDSSLLVYTNDSTGQIKWHKYKKKDNLVKFDLLQYIRCRPGQCWNAPYEVVLKVIPNGTYNELAHAYGQWGRKQWWAKPKLSEKIKRCPLLKRYFYDGIIRYSAPPFASGKVNYIGPNASYYRDEKGAYHYKPNKRSKYEPYYDSIITAMDEQENGYDIKPGYWFPVWSGHFWDTAFPDYFPVLKCMGDLNEFKKSCIENQRPVMYHINIAHWPLINPTTKKHPEYYAISEKGNHYYQTWSELRHVLVSPDVSLPREMKTVRALVDKQKVNGIYLDVIGHAFAIDENPNSKFSKYPNGYQRAKMLAFKTIRDAGEGPLMTESRNEIVLSYIDMGSGTNGKPETDQVPLWQMVYGDCAGSVTCYVKGRSLRNFTWSRGGVQAVQWEWPTLRGKDINVYCTSTQQRVVSHVVGKLLRRFDRLAGSLRISHWDNAVVIWNNESIGNEKTYDAQTTSQIGDVEVKEIAPGGLVMLVKDSPDFIADSVQEIILDGKPIFRCSINSLIITRGGDKWIIHNPSKKSVSAKLILADKLAPMANLKGYLVNSELHVKVPVTRKEAGIVLSLNIPAEDCLVLK